MSSTRRLSGLAPALLLALPLVSGAAPSQGSRPPFTEKEARALARDVSVAVERIRGLRFRTPVTVKFVDDATARSHFKARLAKFWPADEVALETRAYIQLGLMEPGTDVVAVVLDLLEEQAGGYYDPDEKAFFILSDMPRAVAPVLMAHELTHALEDQHFELDKLLAETSLEEDRGSAMGAVIEGSGTLVMTAYMVREIEAGRLQRRALVELQQSDAGRAAKLRKSSPILQRMLMAPYLLGPAFLSRGDLGRVSSGVISPRDLDHVFRNPPRSTEQILHPAKYWDRKKDEPVRVTIPDLSGKIGQGWRLGLEGALGELTLALLVGASEVDPTSPEALTPSSWTNGAATGWGGDRLQVYVRGEETVSLLATVWDSPQEAVEFERALPEAPQKRVTRRDRAVVIAVSDAGVGTDALATATLEAIEAR